MKHIISILLLLVICMSVCWSAEGGTLSLSLNDRPLYELFEILKEKGNLTIVYSKEQLSSRGMPVTINLELKHVKALLVLEVASKAAGFTFEKKENIYIILPIKEPAPLEQEGTSSGAAQKTVNADKTFSETKSSTKTSQIKPESEKISAAPEIDMTKSKDLSGGNRYTGNFMYGQGNKIYLNLVIPEVDTKEKKRISSVMIGAVKNRTFTVNEAVKLFGPGSEVKGKEINLFVKALHKQVLIALQDGDLSDTEIHQLRNGFINAVRNRYEGM